MAFALKTKSQSETRGAEKSAPNRKSARRQRSADSLPGFEKPVFQPPGALLPAMPIIQAKLKTGEPARASRSGILQRKCACGGATGMSGGCEECGKKHPLGLQTKLKVNESDDIFEREADRVADQVMAAPASPAVSGAPLRIQRFSGQSNGQVDAAPASVDHALAGTGRPLEPTLRQDMEQRFGHDFSRVRVHSGMAAEQSTQDVNAHAYTVGHNIVFGAGQFAPGTHEGRRLIAHELTHVIQQNGRSAATIQRKERIGEHNWTRVTKITVVSKAVGEGRGRAETADGQKFAIDIEKNNLSVGHFVTSGTLSEEPDWDNWSRIHWDSIGANIFVYYLPPHVIPAQTLTFVVLPKPRAVREVWRDIQALPEHIQEFVTNKYSRATTVEDYERALRIGKKLHSAGVSPDEMYQYTKITDKSKSYSEKSVDAFLTARSTQQAEREQLVVERGKAEAGLFGREALYRRYRSLKAKVKSVESLIGVAANVMDVSPVFGKERDDLDADLVKAGFPNGIVDFEKRIKNYEKLFEQGTLAIALEVLLKYERLLNREYKHFDPGKTGNTSESAKMLGNLAKIREQAQVQFDKASRTRSLLEDLEYDIRKMSESKAYEGRREAERLRRQAARHESAADKLVIDAAPGRAVIGWQDFPREKLLSRATPEDVRYQVAWFIATHEAAIQRARTLLTDNPSHIYELDNLLAHVYEVQGIEKNSIFDLIIRDRASQIQSDKSAKEILLAIIAIALTVVTFGGGTVGLLAAGAVFGIGVANAVRAIEEYDTKTTLYLAQLIRNEPSSAWAILAVIGMGLDATAVVQALNVVVPAAKLFNASGDLAELGKGLAQVDARVSENVMKAAEQVRAAEQQLKAAKGELKGVFTGAGGKVNVAPPSLTAMAALKVGEISARLLAVTYYYIKTRLLKSFPRFIRQLEEDGLIVWSKLAPEEQRAIQQAFQEALELGRTGQLPYGRQIYDRLSEQARATFTPQSVDQFAAQGKAFGKSDEEIIVALESEMQSKSPVKATITSAEQPEVGGTAGIQSTEPPKSAVTTEPPKTIAPPEPPKIEPPKIKPLVTEPPRPVAPAPPRTTLRGAAAGKRVAETEQVLAQTRSKIVSAEANVKRAKDDLDLAIELRKKQPTGGGAFVEEYRDALGRAESELRELRKVEASAAREAEQVANARDSIAMLEKEIADLDQRMSKIAKDSQRADQMGVRASTRPPALTAQGKEYRKLEGERNEAKRMLDTRTEDLTRSIAEQVENWTPGAAAKPGAKKNANTISALKRDSGNPIDVTTGLPMKSDAWAVDHIMSRTEIASDPRFILLDEAGRKKMIFGIPENYMPITIEANSSKLNKSVPKWLVDRARDGKPIPADMAAALRELDDQARKAVEAMFDELLRPR